MSILRQAALLGSCLRGPAALLHPHSWARGYGLGSHVSNDDPLVLEREKERALKGELWVQLTAACSRRATAAVQVRTALCGVSDVS